MRAGILAGMEITKLGHCCLLIEIGGITVLTDPGSFSTAQDAVTGVDLILITHEHADHLHVDSLKRVLANNPAARIMTNSAVGNILAAEGIAHQVLEGTASTVFSDVVIEACDGKHEEIFEEIGQVQNTGYFIAGKFFYPGDSFTAPGKSVDVLALPVAGPWCKISDAIRYALRVKPRTAFPVHDAMLQKERIGGSHAVPAMVLPQHGIDFVALREGETHTFS